MVFVLIAGHHRSTQSSNRVEDLDLIEMERKRKHWWYLAMIYVKRPKDGSIDAVQYRIKRHGRYWLRAESISRDHSELKMV